MPARVKSSPPPNPDAYTANATPSGVRNGMALCLSGGGYRAMLFHLGTLIRVNQAGMLPKLSRVSSVSGGSITSGVLGANWPQLTFSNGIATNFDDVITAPIYKMAGHTIFDSRCLFSEIGSFLGGLFHYDLVINAYRSRLFGHKTLQDLPDSSPANPAPEFIFNATNEMSGSLWRFTKPYMADWRVGMVRNPKIDLATVVAASSAFPVLLPPVYLPLDHTQVEDVAGTELHKPPYTTKAILVDGGVYDNLGTEAALKEFSMILVSDASGPFGPKADPALDGRDLVRILGITNDQVVSLRRRQLVSAYKLAPGNTDYRDGAYWGITTDIVDYPLKPDERLDCPVALTAKLANVPTVLERLPDATRRKLVNWGFAVCDAALRSYCVPVLKRYGVELTQPADFPYKDAKV